MMPYSLNFQSAVTYGRRTGTSTYFDTAEKPVREPEKIKDQILVPLSDAQKRLWYLCQLSNVGNSYNLIQEFELMGSLEISSLEQAIQKVINRQPALRSSFVKIGDEVFKQIHPELTCKVSFLNFSNRSQADQKAKIQEASVAFANHEFDLSKGPLINVNVIWFGQQHYRLMINMHHIISDGWSFEIFKKELSAYYNTIINNEQLTLPKLPVPEVQVNNNGHEIANQLAYWQKKFEDAPQLLELPDRRLRPAVQTFNGKRIHFDLDKNFKDNFTVFCQQANCSGYIGLLATFKLLLSRYTAREDIVIGSPFSGRHKNQQKQAYIDFFVNTVPLRTQLIDDLSFLECLNATKNTVHEAFPNQGIPFDKLVESINPGRNPSFSPLFQIMFVYQNYTKESFHLQNLEITRTKREVINAKFDLTLEITEELEGQLSCAIDYNSDIYNESMVTRFANHFKELLKNVINNPNIPVKEHSILTKPEFTEIVYNWNKTTVSYPMDKCLPQLFEEQVANSPNAIALSYAGTDMTYQNLNIKANQLAHLLISSGVHREDFVGIQVNRSFEMVISVLAVLKAGAAYVAIDPEYPEERKNYMLEDASIKVLLSTSDLLSNFPAKRIDTIFIDADHGRTISQQSIENPKRKVLPNDLAYMIYTSGSTGQPKGVLIEHKGIPNLIYDHIRKYGLKQGNCVLQFASLSFDASICEIGMALLSGATLCIAKKDQILPGPELIRLLNKEKISHVTLPPSALGILPKAELPTLKVITVTGEACPEFLIDKWGKGRKFFNGYGPSEVTIGATISEFRKGSKKTSIGRPFANYRVYILDKNRKPVPVGVPGEIYVSGIGLARGYFNNSQSTTEKFVACPFEEFEAKMYKTGDMARFLPDGEIEFLGRDDNLVKLRGMRIELGEIEAFINEYTAIRQSKVILSGDDGIHRQIIAYFTPMAAKDPKVDDIKTWLQEKLPKHMIPAAFVKIDKFPKSPNGKIDLKALTKISDHITTVNDDHVKPGNAIEHKLANIWANLLNLEEIGITDNFFDLGGHSLLAVCMVTQIEEQLGASIRVSSLMQYPTVEKLAVLITENTDETCCEETIVCINEGGSQPPVFLFHTPSGHVLSYYKLAEHLPDNCPVYGIEVKGIAANKKPYYSLKTLAKFYASEIKKFKPAGSYNLGGYCFGGLLAYEVAVALKSSGETIDHLFLIGSKFPTNNLPEIIIGENETLPEIKFNEKAPVSALNQKSNLRSGLFYLKKKISKHLWLAAFKYYKRRNLPLPGRLEDFKLIHHQMIKSHSPGIFEGDVHLIQPDKKLQSAHLECIRSWQKLVTGQVISHQTQGFQSQLLEAPYAAGLGHLIKDIMIR